jgi:hypothetical protein
MKNSIYQVPINGRIIDLHYLLSISDVFNDFGLNIELTYQLSEKPIRINIRRHFLSSEDTSKLNEDEDNKFYKEKFETLIRSKIIEAWTDYRNNL